MTSAAQGLRAACPHNVEVQLLQAGHCPHDEAPALVNAALLEFVRSRIEDRAGAEAGSERVALTA